MGTGDAELPYRLARRDASRLFVGIDANADGMLATARKAARKPAKGGVDNLVLIAARVEERAPELHAIADAVTIYFPWAGLLQALLGRNDDGLAGIAWLCKPGARIDAVLSVDESRDAAMGLVAPTVASLATDVRERWRACGLALQSSTRLDTAEVRALETSWAKRLGFGAPREVWRLVGNASGDAIH